METPMTTARKPVDILSARVAEIDSEIASKLAEKEELKRAIQTLKGEGAPQHREARRSPESGRVSVMPELETILNEQPDREFHASELVAALEERGIPMKQVNPDNTVATAMGRLADKGIAEKLGGNRFRKRVTLNDALMRAVRSAAG